MVAVVVGPEVEDEEGEADADDEADEGGKEDHCLGSDKIFHQIFSKPGIMITG